MEVGYYSQREREERERERERERVAHLPGHCIVGLIGSGRVNCFHS